MQHGQNAVSCAPPQRWLAVLALCGLVVGAPASATAQTGEGDPAAQVQELERFRTGRNLATAGGYVSLGGSAVSIAGLIVASRSPQVGTYISYGGAGLGSLGFALEAGGLGLQHSAAANLGRDTGRGLFAGGTTLGVLGIVSAGAGYFLGGTSYVSGDNRDIAILSCLAGSFVFSTTAHILYGVDQRRLARAMLGLYQF